MRWLERLTPRLGLLLLGLAGCGTAGMSFVIQEWGHLNPCPLCIFQRVLYMVFGLVALLGALPPLKSRGHRIFGVVLALIALGNALTAIYQSVMQARPDLINECSYTDPGLIERFVDWLGMQYPTLFMATGLCSSQEWVFLGLSMANWSVVCSLILIALALWLTRCFRRGNKAVA
jgi:disulfide bond formation protein DsbB